MVLSRIIFILSVFIFLTPSVFLTLGCRNLPDTKNAPPETLLKYGKRAARANRWIEAQDLFKQVLEDYPDSDERVEALLLLGDALYKDKQYEEAKFNYQKFTELYPAHPRVDHAHFFKAMCDYRMMDIATRDQTPTVNALHQFERVIKEFPKSQYHDPAVAKKKDCEEKLARNIMEISRFYYRSGSYLSAIKRLQHLLTEYPDQKFNDEAIFLLADSYFHEQNFSLAKEAFKELLKRYPRSRYAKEARIQLKKIR